MRQVASTEQRALDPKTLNTQCRVFCAVFTYPYAINCHVQVFEKYALSFDVSGNFVFLVLDVRLLAVLAVL